MLAVSLTLTPALFALSTADLKDVLEPLVATVVSVGTVLVVVTVASLAAVLLALVESAFVALLLLATVAADETALFVSLVLFTVAAVKFPEVVSA